MADVVARKEEAVFAGLWSLEVTIKGLATLVNRAPSRLKDELMSCLDERVSLCSKVSEADACARVGWVVKLASDTRLAWLGDSVDGRTSSLASYAGKLLHGGGRDLARDTGDRDGSALEAPAFQSELLATLNATLVGADFLDDGVRAHVPAVIARKVAMTGRVTNVGVASDEACAGHTLSIWLLVSVNGAQTVDEVAIEAVVSLDSLLPIVEVSVDGELLHGHTSIGSGAVPVHSLGVDVPVDALAAVNLVGDNIVNNWRVLTSVAKLAMQLVSGAVAGRGCVLKVIHAEEELDWVGATGWEARGAIKVGEVGLEKIHDRGRCEGKLAFLRVREELVVAYIIIILIG